MLTTDNWTGKRSGKREGGVKRVVWEKRVARRVTRIHRNRQSGSASRELDYWKIKRPQPRANLTVPRSRACARSMSDAVSWNRDCLRPAKIAPHVRNTQTHTHTHTDRPGRYTHGTAVDFIVPDRGAWLLAACGSSERKLLTPRLGDCAVGDGIEARRESPIDSVRRRCRGKTETPELPANCLAFVSPAILNLT